MRNGMKATFVVVCFVVTALLVQMAFAQANSTGTKIFVTNLTITRSDAVKVMNPVQSPINYRQVPDQRLFNLALLAVLVASLIVLLAAKMLSKKAPKAGKNKSKRIPAKRKA